MEKDTAFATNKDSGELVSGAGCIPVYGMPDSFWVVKKPSGGASLKDIMVNFTFTDFMLQTGSGLSSNDLAGIFADEHSAREEAERLLGKNDIPPAGLAGSLRMPYRIAVRQGYDVIPEKNKLLVSFPDRASMQHYAYKVENYANIRQGDTALSLVLEA